MQQDPAHRTISIAPLHCLECDRLWIEATERWRVYLSNEQPRVPLIYCPDCSRREFD